MWRWLVLPVVALAGLTGAPVGAAEGAGHDHVVVIRHGRFDPAEVEVGVGESVTWRHDDGDDPHSITADDGSFDSSPECSEAAPERCMRSGDTFTHTFAAAGRVAYHSRTEDISGVVTVVDEHEHH